MQVREGNTKLVWILPGESKICDKETVERINDTQKMDADIKNILFNIIDTCIQNLSLLRKPQNPISQSYNSLKINMPFQENFGKKTFRSGLMK